jgi:hypothetical protein
MQENKDKFSRERKRIEQFFEITKHLCSKNNIKDSEKIKEINYKLSSMVDKFVHNKVDIKDIYREFYRAIKE